MKSKVCCTERRVEGVAKKEDGIKEKSKKSNSKEVIK